jgi:HPt (histidine-containing phosphotransfer) domain-containing protein
LDVENALIRFSNDRDFYYNLLEDFLQTLPDRLTEIKTAVESGDAQNLSYQAHSLKGVAANFSARQLARLATSLDDISRSGDLSSAQSLMTEVETAVGKLQTFVAELRGNQEEIG